MVQLGVSDRSDRESPILVIIVPQRETDLSVFKFCKLAWSYPPCWGAGFLAIFKGLRLAFRYTS